MKKISILFLSLITLSLGANAQLRVLSNGHVQVGNWGTSSNRPNPFKATTEIKCHLPQEVSEAFICIYDLNGRQQMCLDLGERGDVSVTVSGSTLAPGMYIYSLIADGREADSKRMILTE